MIPAPPLFLFLIQCVTITLDVFILFQMLFKFGQTHINCEDKKACEHNCISYWLTDFWYWVHKQFYKDEYAQEDYNLGDRALVHDNASYCD